MRRIADELAEPAASESNGAIELEPSHLDCFNQSSFEMHEMKYPKQESGTTWNDGDQNQG